MAMGEGEVYYYTKKFLRLARIAVFGGEPPGGSDDLHRIELKHPSNAALGSKGSRKFDLLAFFEGRLLLLELKDSSSKLVGDIEKLNDTVASEAWTGKLWDNLNDRRLLGRILPAWTRNDFVTRRGELLVKCLGAPPSAFAPPDGFLLFEVTERSLVVRATTFEPASLLSALVRALSID
jgi:hypothetical protein